MDESVTERVRPIAAIAPEAISKYPAWYYRVALLGCEQISTPQPDQAIHENLPEWIRH